MFIVDEEGKKGLRTKIVDSSIIFKALSNPLREKILRMIHKDDMYPAEIAKKLKTTEQKIHYHIKLLERTGLIEVKEEERIRGGVAKKYRVSSDSYSFLMPDAEWDDFKPGRTEMPQFLRAFVKNGKLDAVIVVGSPDPHGPHKARARDIHYVGDLGLYLGTYANITKCVTKTDVEIMEKDKQKNLIIIGGPFVNLIASEINEHLPIRFNTRDGVGIYSTLSKNDYYDEETGIIVITNNPFNENKKVMFIAGIRYFATRSAILALIKHQEEIEKGNVYDTKTIAKVINGYDIDGDRIVDTIEFRE